MTLQEFTRDVVPILSLVVSTLGLLSLGLLWYQLRNSTKWSKLQGQANFLNRSLDDLESQLNSAMNTLGLKFYLRLEPLSPSECVAVLGDPSAFAKSKSYLNAYEDLAAAVRIGFVDEDFAYALEATRLLKAWRIFEPLANEIRVRHNSDAIYNELENVVIRWAERVHSDVERRALQQRHARADIGITRRKV